MATHYSQSSATHRSTRRIPRTNKFIISPAAERDVEILVHIEFGAFAEEKTNQYLSYRHPTNPLHKERATRSYKNTLRGRSNSAHRRSNLDLYPLRKVTDGENGPIISFSKIEMKAYTAAELASPPDVGHEHDELMNREWFGLNERLRREYMQTRCHCYVGMLATSPRYQYRGAGTMLIEDILKDVDEAGIECYLEATDTAKPLYERHGFQEVNVISFSPAEFGVIGFKVERQTVMVRGALINGERQAVKSWEEAKRGASPPPSLRSESSEGEENA